MIASDSEAYSCMFCLLSNMWYVGTNLYVYMYECKIERMFLFTKVWI